MDKPNEQQQEDFETDEVEQPIANNPFYGSAKMLMEKYNHCALCGANLHFSHQTDFHRNLTQEIAKCPECGVKNREILHKLQ